jgi:arginyl-tRNA synthetase
MSSRTGDVYTAEKLLDDVEATIAKQYPDSKVKEDVFTASIRYTFLSQRVGTNIVFNTQESVGLEGNSGPYIQYAHARGRSILDKASKMDEKLEKSLRVASIPFEKSERLLAAKISEFSEIVERSIEEFMPHHICNYLYELAQEFNRFYEKNRVIDDPRMFTRLVLVKSYTEVLKSGLNLLGIPAPMHM